MNLDRTILNGKLNSSNRFLLGLVIALSMSLLAFEYTTIEYEIKDLKGGISNIDDDEILPPITYQVPKEQPKIIEKTSTESVSYTHLTLPTIYSV